MSILTSRRTFLLAIPAVIVAGATAGSMTTPPEGLDLSLTRMSDAGVYRVTLEPEAQPMPTGRMQTVTVAIKTASGRPVENAEITVSGGMPQHGHGLPTKPRVMQDLGGGRYQIGGVKFNMRGWWTLSLDVRGEPGSDTVTFNLVL